MRYELEVFLLLVIRYSIETCLILSNNSMQKRFLRCILYSAFAQNITIQLNPTYHCQTHLVTLLPTRLLRPHLPTQAPENRSKKHDVTMTFISICSRPKTSVGNNSDKKTSICTARSRGRRVVAVSLRPLLSTWWMG